MDTLVRQVLGDDWSVVDRTFVNWSWLFVLERWRMVQATALCEFQSPFADNAGYPCQTIARRDAEGRMVCQTHWYAPPFPV